MNNNLIPLVSVYIPTYYHEKYISQAIEPLKAYLHIKQILNMKSLLKMLSLRTRYRK